MRLTLIAAAVALALAACNRAPEPAPDAVALAVRVARAARAARVRFFPCVVFPGTHVTAGEPLEHLSVTLLRTETIQTPDGDTRGLVTFDEAPETG